MATTAYSNEQASQLNVVPFNPLKARGRECLEFYRSLLRQINTTCGRAAHFLNVIGE